MGDISLTDPMNNREPQAWRPLDVSKIMQVTVPENATAAQMLDAFKQVEAAAVDLIYGTSKDDKWQKLINLIMLRFRAALDELSEVDDKSLQTSTTEITTQFSQLKDDLVKLVDNASADAYVQDNSDKYDEIKKAVLKQSEALGKIAAQHEAQKAVDNAMRIDKNKALDEASRSRSNAKADVEQSTAQQEPKQQSEAPRQSQPAEDQSKSRREDAQPKEASQDRVSQQNAIAAQESIQSGLVALSNAIDQSMTAGQRQLDTKAAQPAKQNVNAVAARIDQASQQVKKAESMSPQQVIAAAQSQMSQGVFNTKQFSTFMGFFRTIFGRKAKEVEQRTNQMNAAVENVDTSIKKLDKKLDKSSFPWFKIMLLASTILVPMFWDKIKSVLKWLNEKFDITKTIDDFIARIDWKKHINSVIDYIKEPLYKKIDEFIGNPLKLFFSDLVKIWNKLTEWFNDIKGYISGSSDEAKSLIDQKEEQSIQRSQEMINALQTSLSQSIEAEQRTSAKIMQESTSKAMQESDRAVNDANASIRAVSAASLEAQMKSADRIQSMGQEIDKVQLPQTLDKAGDVVLRASDVVDESAKTVQKEVGNVVDSEKAVQTADVSNSQLESIRKNVQLDPLDVQGTEYLYSGTEVKGERPSLPSPAGPLSKRTQDALERRDQKLKAPQQQPWSYSYFYNDYTTSSPVNNISFAAPHSPEAPVVMINAKDLSDKPLGAQPEIAYNYDDSIDKAVKADAGVDQAIHDSVTEIAKLRRETASSLNQLASKATDIKNSIPSEHRGPRALIVPMSYGPVDNACMRR